ncbi:hypothetical protein DB88DRAFT_435470 [Papiliotrema laurentii]|uniref:Uncharacterized protein n=1 Tax=Papiliotrema laurentii TaxID=5418 RepID=A0AAD9L7T5_PAPLA|nr:hypothetical protein DB88DRAFT_435470 [Papiliotrema laurentii]
MSPPLPASSTKHLDVISHPLPRDALTVLPLEQLSSDPDSAKSTGTTGTTLWLGGQVLSCYLSSLPLPARSPAKPAKRAIELGAGVGYLSLVLASLGYDVVSTDIPPVLETVLRPNVMVGLDVLRRSTAQTPVVQVCELDWTTTTAHTVTPGADLDLSVDMIITSDTIYHPDLLPHLFRTIACISRSSLDNPQRSTPPTVYLCLERRDSRMVDTALSRAAEFGLHLKRVGHGRVAKCVEKTGWGWAEEDWQGVEVYKGRWSQPDTHDSNLTAPSDGASANV